MREILFRGKRCDNGEWVEGSLIVWGDGSMTIETGVLNKPMYAVDPTTVGQYTGMKDKNGQRIFEGDVLCSIYTKRNYPVFFGEYSCIDEYGGEEISCGWYNEDSRYNVPIGDTECWALIVGNIHDNPELLEV